MGGDAATGTPRSDGQGIRGDQGARKDLVPLVIAETGATLAVGSSMQVTVAATRFARYAQDHAPHR